MKISEAIAKLQRLQEAEGDLEIFDNEGWAVDGFTAEDASDFCFPAEWNMPDRFVQARTGK